MGSFWDHFRIDLGSCSDHFGIISESVWDHVGIILGSFWDHVGIILGSFWDHFGTILGSFWDHFGIILGSFGNNFGMILKLFRDHCFWAFSHWGNQAGIIGGTRLGVRGTAAPELHNTILYQVSKNPKGKPGWGNSNTVKFAHGRTGVSFGRT